MEVHPHTPSRQASARPRVRLQSYRIPLRRMAPGAWLPGLAAAAALLAPAIWGPAAFAQAAMTQGEALTLQREFAEGLCPAEFAAARLKGDMDIWVLPGSQASQPIPQPMLDVLASPNGVQFAAAATQSRAMDGSIWLLMGAAERGDLDADHFLGFAKAVDRQLALHKCLWPEGTDFSAIGGLPDNLVGALDDMRLCIVETAESFVRIADLQLSGPALRDAVNENDRDTKPACAAVAEATK